MINTTSTPLPTADAAATAVTLGISQFATIATRMPFLSRSGLQLSSRPPRPTHIVVFLLPACRSSYSAFDASRFSYRQRHRAPPPLPSPSQPPPTPRTAVAGRSRRRQTPRPLPSRRLRIAVVSAVAYAHWRTLTRTRARTLTRPRHLS